MRASCFPSSVWFLPLISFLFWPGDSASAQSRQAPSLYRIAQQAVAKDYTKETKTIGARWNNPFKEVPKQGGLLIGFDVAVWKNNQRLEIIGIRPIYRTALGVVYFKEYGQFRQSPEPNNRFFRKKEIINLKLKATPGFAVGQITVRESGRLLGMCLTYFRVKSNRLDEKLTYKSSWVGEKKHGRERELSSEENPIVGVIGHVGAERLDSIGLVHLDLPEGFLEPPKKVVSQPDPVKPKVDAPLQPLQAIPKKAPAKVAKVNPKFIPDPLKKIAGQHPEKEEHPEEQAREVKKQLPQEFQKTAEDREEVSNGTNWLLLCLVFFGVTTIIIFGSMVLFSILGTEEKGKPKKKRKALPPPLPPQFQHSLAHWTTELTLDSPQLTTAIREGPPKPKKRAVPPPLPGTTPPIP